MVYLLYHVRIRIRRTEKPGQSRETWDRFIEAQELWNDPYFIEIPAKTSDEHGFLVIGRIRDKHWSAVITPRSNKIRIISVHRSRQEEVAIYES